MATPRLCAAASSHALSSEAGHSRPIDNVYAMSAYPPTAVELSQRSEPPLRAMSDILHSAKSGEFNGTFLPFGDKTKEVSGWRVPLT
jgi:hypothetical protein